MADDTSTKPAGRRQQHKMRTERALQQAALELFAKQGYDTTTTDEISERAGVSPRTFFRYFATKESVLFVGEYGWIQSFSKHYQQQPGSLSDLDAVRQTLLDAAPRLSVGRRSFVLYERAIASSPTLRGRVQDHIQENITTLAEAVAARRGLGAPDERCSLLAAVVLITYRRALTRWLVGSASDNLQDLINDEFAMLADLTSPASSNGHEPPARSRAKRAAVKR